VAFKQMMVAFKQMMEVSGGNHPLLFYTQVKEGDVREFTAIFQPSEFLSLNNPYKNTKIRLQISFQDFPRLPPTIKLLTPILHPNLHEIDEMDLEILDPANWERRTTIRMVLSRVIDLMKKPDLTKDPVQAELLAMYVHRRRSFKTMVEVTQDDLAPPLAYLVEGDWIPIN